VASDARLTGLSPVDVTFHGRLTVAVAGGWHLVEP
jgi:hypothetical protein